MSQLQEIKRFGITCGYKIETDLAGKLGSKGWDHVVSDLQHRFKAIGTRPKADGKLREFKAQGWRIVVESGKNRDSLFIETKRSFLASTILGSVAIAFFGIAHALSMSGMKSLFGFISPVVAVIQLPIFIRLTYRPFLQKIEKELFEIKEMISRQVAGQLEFARSPDEIENVEMKSRVVFES